MRIAAIYDIHGNLPALEAVLEDIESADVDMIVVGGDVVPGPMPRETLDLLLSLDLPTRFLRGNNDREAIAIMKGEETEWYRKASPDYREPVIWSANQLDPARKNELERWPVTIRVEIPSLGSVLFCHATPRSDNEIFTQLTPDDRLGPVFEAIADSVVVCGHTHMQFDRNLHGLRILNAGSVGMPFGSPGAYWALVGPEIELRQTDYDLSAATDRIRQTEFPNVDEFVSRNILSPPSEATMMKMFSRAKLLHEQ